MSTTQGRNKVLKSHPRLNLVQQCNILKIHCSGTYYKPRGERVYNLILMNELDAYFLEHPYYWVERMTNYPNLNLGNHINVKRVRWQYKLIGLQTIYRKPKTNIKDPKSYKYSYLLKIKKNDYPNQIWQTDINYIPMFVGLCI